MELTKKEEELITHIRNAKKDLQHCVITVKYTPIGENGHIQTILTGKLMPIVGLRSSLVNLLKDIQRITTKNYTVLATYDAGIKSLNVYKMLLDYNQVDNKLQQGK